MVDTIVLVKRPYSPKSYKCSLSEVLQPGCFTGSDGQIENLEAINDELVSTVGRLLSLLVKSNIINLEEAKLIVGKESYEITFWE